MKEIWKDIDGYENKYQVSNFGRIKSLNYGGKTGVVKIMRPLPTRLGYLLIALYKNGCVNRYLIHRLVAIAFLTTKRKKEVNHLDGIKSNNRSDNLEWCTHADNVKHSIKIGLHPTNAREPIQYNLDGKFIKKYKSTLDAAQNTGIDYSCISRACRGINSHAGGYIWKYNKPRNRIT